MLQLLHIGAIVLQLLYCFTAFARRGNSLAALVPGGSCFATFTLAYGSCTQGQLSCSICTVLSCSSCTQGYKLVKCSVDTVRLKERLSVYIRFTCHVLYARDLHETYIYINTALE